MLGIRIHRLSTIRTKEASMVAIVAGLFAVIEAGRAIGWNAGDALLLHHFGVGPLPYLYIAAGMISSLVLLSYTAGLARVSQIAVHVGIGITATNTLFNAVPREHRSAALSFNASVPKQLGIVLSGTLLPFGSHNFDTRLVPLAGILLSLVCVALVLRIRGLYGAAPATSQ